jgi:hypothetical protein
MVDGQTFSDADLVEPIFREPPDDIGREDAWGGPYAFLLGGMGEPSIQDIAAQYFDAANQLVDNIQGQKVEDYTVALPVLFLYRHAIELILKAAMRGGDGHELDKLADQFSAFIEREYKENVPAWLMNRLYEVADIDPRSTSFRYAVKARTKKGNIPLGGEHFIDLPHLQRSMTALYEVLKKVANTSPPG